MIVTNDWAELPMLETLDNIPWHTKSHAYGPAEDVPDLIRQLLIDDPKVRSDVMWTLYGNVFHQGTRYPATPFVIPFLIELCGAPEVHGRGELLRFWGDLIVGYFNIRERPNWGDGEHVYFCGEIQEVEPDDEYAIALHDIYRESLRGESLLYSLLTEDDDSIRAGAVWVLACLPTIRESSSQQLQQMLRSESNPWVRAAIAFASGEFHRPDILHELLQSPNEHAAVKCMSACQLARIAPDESVVEPLLQFISEPIDGFDQIPGAGGESTGDAAFSITFLPKTMRQRAVPRICERLEHARSFATMPLATALLSAGFDEQEDLVTELTPLQRHILLCMLNSQELWSIGNLFFTFKEYGLPHDRDRCAELAGVNVAKDEALSELSIAVTFSDMGFLEKARDGIEKALSIDPAVFARVPSPEECWLFCAKAFAETDPERALTAYENATSIDPSIARRIGVTWKLADLIGEM